MHVVVVGAGVIGLSIAWRALDAGAQVTVIDPDPASQASHASAGMLPPSSEVLYTQQELLRLCLESRDRWPSFVAEVEAASGRLAGYSRYGVLDVALDEQSMDVLDGLWAFEEELGISSKRLTGPECRAAEPRLAPSVRGGLLASDDGAVNPRQLNAALLGAIAARGGTLVRQRAAGVVLDGRAAGVRLDSRAAGVRLAGGAVIEGDRTVLAAGCWTHQLDGLPPGAVPRIHPYKGQILRLRSDGPFLRRAVRGLRNGTAIYLVPRGDGELVVGATYEECGYDTRVTAGGLTELLGKAQAVLPEAADLELAEAGVGLRPGSPDGLPVLGETSVPDLLLASGHSRIGVQLAPVTADVLTELIFTGNLPDVAKPFTPSRFPG